jgi:predicted metal-dependent hydrolase
MLTCLHAQAPSHATIPTNSTTWGLLMETRILRSDKRIKTVSARIVDGVLEILAPGDISDSELTPIIAQLRSKIEKKQQKRQQRQELDNKTLAQIANRLNREYFHGRLRWETLEWSTQQNKRYGSCTPALRSIRISHRLASMPPFVLEYVVMHELAHLIEANHGPRFWQLVNQYPRTERARGYLMAVGLEELDEPAS